jgi:hypothetical protein
MKVPELKGGQMLTLAYFIGILIILFIVYKILGKLGLIETKEDKKEDAAASEIRSLSYFEPLYLKDKKDYIPLVRVAQFYAAQLLKALYGLGTDEETVYSVFGKLKSKENIAEIAMYYAKDYNRNLQADLLNDLSDSEMLTLTNIINKLPND